MDLYYLDSVQDGTAALHMASQEGHCGIVRMLLEAKADVHNKTNVSHAAWWCLCTLLIPWLSVCTVTSVLVSFLGRFFRRWKRPGVHCLGVSAHGNRALM